jgi:hypothetical protein
LTWLSSTTQHGTPVIIGDGAYGLNTQVTGAYQQVVVPMSAFAIPAGITVDRLRWEVTGGSGAVGFYLDDWLIQAGISTEPAPIMLYRGAWSTDTVYNTNIVVSRSGGTYIALEPNQGQDPLTTASWALLAANLDDAASLGSGEAPDTYVLMADGDGGADWESLPVSVSAESDVATVVVAIVAELPVAPTAGVLYFVKEA